MTRIGRDWGRAFFRPAVFTPGGPEHRARAPREAAFVLKALGARKGQRLLDVCCGTGRHSVEFARRGLDVVGVDITPAYLAEAKKAGKRYPRLRFVKGDMRSLPFRAEFDAAVNLWTSFGYFLRRSDDLRALRSIARALKPGGRFLIDVVDADYLDKNTQPRNWERLPDGTYHLEDIVARKGADPAHIVTWTRIRPGGRTASAPFFVRLYNEARLSALLRRAGLTPLKRWGSPVGKPYQKGKSHRLLILAVKRK